MATQTPPLASNAQHSQQRRRTPTPSRPSCPGPGVFPPAPPPLPDGVGVEVAQCARTTPVIRGRLGSCQAGRPPVSDDAVVIAEVARAFPSPLDVAGPWSAVRVRHWTHTQLSPTQRFLKSGLQRDSDLNMSMNLSKTVSIQRSRVKQQPLRLQHHQPCNNCTKRMPNSNKQMEAVRE